MSAAARAPVRTYVGPTCPRCSAPLNASAVHDGDYTCTYCRKSFEVRVFHPQVRDAVVTQLALQGPDEGTPCAYHARNAAASACERCGVFICSLCEMSTDAGRFCPSCFDRAAQEPERGGTTRTRIRDYGSMAMLSAVVGLLMAVILGIPGGILAWYYGIKAWRNPEQSSAGRGRLIVAMTVGVFDFAFGALFVYGIIAAAAR
ncbi:MAG TPA: hypothetical protein VN181_16045 [Thermoanaerobaculia bacterium]|nr:hypothetical protein [Thermoanaerobaculia bacterium]